MNSNDTAPLKVRAYGRPGFSGTVQSVAIAVISLSVLPQAVQASQDEAARQGQETFQTLCAMCHTIGGGRLVGPDLQGVGERRSEEWLIEFVLHSQQLIAAGDADAVALFEEYGGLTMSDQPLTESEVRTVLAYIGTGAATPQTQAPVVAEATEEQVLLGQALFQGTTRLDNAGPACNACHDVTNEGFFGGGVLARDLTDAVSRLQGPAGVRAILGSPPFPVMQRAYQDKPLTDDEVAALVGFLQRVDAEQSLYQPRDYGIGLLLAGVVGTVLLLGLYSLIWRGRLRGSVNQSIYDRQIKST